MQVYGLVGQTEEGIWPEAQLNNNFICLVSEISQTLVGFLILV